MDLDERARQREERRRQREEEMKRWEEEQAQLRAEREKRRQERLAAIDTDPLLGRSSERRARRERHANDTSSVASTDIAPSSDFQKESSPTHDVKQAEPSAPVAAAVKEELPVKAPVDVVVSVEPPKEETVSLDPKVAAREAKKRELAEKKRLQMEELERKKRELEEKKRLEKEAKLLKKSGKGSTVSALDTSVSAQRSAVENIAGSAQLKKVEKEVTFDKPSVAESAKAVVTENEDVKPKVEAEKVVQQPAEPVAKAAESSSDDSDSEDSEPDYNSEVDEEDVSDARISDLSQIDGLLDETESFIQVDSAKIKYDKSKRRYQLEGLKYDGNPCVLITCLYEFRPSFLKTIDAGVNDSGGHLRTMYGWGRASFRFKYEKEEDEWTEENFPYILIEPAKKTLDYFLKKKRFHSFKEVVEGMLSIAQGLLHFHRRGLAVGDLHAGKIMYVRAGNFKLSEYLYVWDPYDETVWGGTPLYQAPELIRSRLLHETNVTVDKKSDIFSYGYVAWQMLTKFHTKKFVDIDDGYPDTEDFLEKMLNKNQRPKFPPGCNAQLREIISACWNRDVEERPSAHEIVSKLSNLLVNMGSQVSAVRFRGTDYSFVSEPKTVGYVVQDFSLYDGEFSKVVYSAYKGRSKVLYFTPSLYLDKMDEVLEELNSIAVRFSDKAVVMVITQDNPLTIDNFVKSGHAYLGLRLLSTWGTDIVKDFGVELSGPLPGFCSCTAFVVAPSEQVTYVEVVEKLPGEPSFTTIRSII